MFISIIIGSSRPKSQSAKVGQYVSSLVTSKHSLHSVKDLLPKLWDNDAFENIKEQSVSKNEIVSKELNQADAFIFVIPEWNGPARYEKFISNL